MTKATASFAEYAQELEQEPVVITINGKPVTALVDLKNIDMETISLGNNLVFMSIIKRSQRQKNKGG